MANDEFQDGHVEANIVGNEQIQSRHLNRSDYRVKLVILDVDFRAKLGLRPHFAGSSAPLKPPAGGSTTNLTTRFWVVHLKCSPIVTGNPCYHLVPRSLSYLPGQSHIEVGKDWEELLE
jgi:hypothetical protein